MADEVEPTGKGIAGCALLGGEAALLVESLMGVRNGWALGLIPLATAAGGGVGGYFLEQNASPEANVAMLVAGMALIIPTTIITLKSTAYSIEEEEGWTDAGDDEEPMSPASEESTEVERSSEVQTPPTEATPPPTAEPPPETPPEGGGSAPPSPSGSLLQIGPGSLTIGIPSIAVVGSYSASEMRRYGLTQRTELRIPVLQAEF